MSWPTGLTTPPRPVEDISYKWPGRTEPQRRRRAADPVYGVDQRAGRPPGRPQGVPREPRGARDAHLGTMDLPHGVWVPPGPPLGHPLGTPVHPWEPWGL